MHARVLWALGVIIAVVAIGLAIYQLIPLKSESVTSDGHSQDVTISGTYGCLKHRDATGPQTEECAFGFHADTGAWYAANFGQSASAMEQWKGGAHVTVKGSIVPVAALNTDQWQKYDMQGILTVYEVLESNVPSSNAKINIDAVCKGALAYTTFPDAASADAFVAECKEGKHPGVIERYKANLHLDGATI